MGDYSRRAFLAIAGAAADAAAAVLVDGTEDDNQPFLTKFPYLGTPNSGSEVLPGTPST